jgi:hypothetical protein
MTGMRLVESVIGWTIGGSGMAHNQPEEMKTTKNA